MSCPAPTVALYGPSPTAPHRTGGVAKWLQYLEAICDTASVPSLSLYIDRAVIDDLPLPHVVRRALGSCACVLDIFRLSRPEHTVIHVNTSVYPSTVLRDWPVVVAAVARGAPIFLQVHGGRLANLEVDSIQHRAFHWMCRQADALGIHPGPQLYEFVKEGYGHKIRQMHNVVPETQGIAALRDHIAHFLYLGRLTREKGVDKALENALRLRKEGYKNVEMTIAGDGPLLNRFQETLKKSRHSDAIFLEGFVRGEALEAVLRRANVFVLPSRHQEGFPFSYLECAERGMACIVTENSAIPEVFKRGIEFQPVDLSEPDDLYNKMKRMATDVDHRQRIGRAGQEAVRICCTIEAAAGQFRKLYSDLTKSSTA